MLSTTAATAVEMADGRIQAHGFAEMQIRGISSSFSEELNLTQFYNILNLELEFDIAPDGVGPFDLISAFVRLEGRYDCVYSSGCGLSPNTRTFGDRSNNLPPRLADAQDRDFAGVIDLNDVEPFLDPTGRPNTVEEVFEDTRDSGRTTGLLSAKGADPIAAHVFADPTDPNDPTRFATVDPPDDDPGRYTLNSVLDYAFAAKNVNGPANGGIGLMAPWLPRNFVTDAALLIDRANPYRGRAAPVIAGRAQRTRFYEGDPALAENGGTLIPENPVDPIPGFQDVFVPNYCSSDQVDNGTCLGSNQVLMGASVVDQIVVPDDLAAQNQNSIDFQFVDRVVPTATAETYVTNDVDTVTNTFSIADHGLRADQPLRAIEGGTLPAGLENDTDYFAIVIDESTFQVSESPGGGAVNLSDPGTGANSFGLPPVTQTFTFDELDDMGNVVGQFTAPGTLKANIDPEVGGPFPAQEVFLVTTGVGRRFFPRAYYLHKDDPRFPESVGDTLEINNGAVTSIQPIIPVFKTAGNEGFGGDLSNIIPALPPEGIPVRPDVPPTNPDVVYCFSSSTRITDAGRCPTGVDNAGRSQRAQGATDGGQVISLDGNGGVYPYTNRQIRGGTGELPMRPAADLSFRDTTVNSDIGAAQGVYYPSAGFRQALATTDFNNPYFNIDETDRSFNRGSSQNDNKELKEAYLDVEMIESRLYMRLGLQNIVWGKTELFRTTDQFNPTDLALSSLPSLEEARIALWAAKFIYSFYDVGPLEDVRLEFAMNLDDYEPTDLGGCGEPYTLDVICGLTLGIAAHGFLGLGVAGFDRPPSFWEDGSGLEFGARVEWRWDRFSFALIDFYGYDDFPSADPIFYFERNVDLATGRPLVTRFTGGDAGAQHAFDPTLELNPEFSGTTGCARPGIDPTTGAFASEVVVAGLQNDPDAVRVNLEFDASKNAFSASPRGIGVDDPCLKAGGLAGFQAANPGPDGEYGTADDGDDNALTYHPANQQFHAFACSATTGIVGLDPTSCALAIFGSTRFLSGGIAPFPASEFFSIVFSGEPSANAFVRSLTNQSRGGDPGQARNVFGPFTILNRDRGPVCDNNTDDPEANAACTAALQAGGWDGILTAANPQINVPDPSLNRISFINEDGELDTRDCGAQSSFDLPPSERSEFSLTNKGPCRQFSFHYDPAGRDWLTLDSVLTNEQKALLGCGPFFGTRCDAADAAPDYQDIDPTFVNPDFPTDCVRCGPEFQQAGLFVEQDAPLIPAGGGIDLLNADASFLFQSWSGIEGTGPDNWTPRLEAAFEAAERERLYTAPDGIQSGLAVDCVDPFTETPGFCLTTPLSLGYAPQQEVTFTVVGRDVQGNPVPGTSQQITGDTPQRFLAPMFPTWLTTAESLLQPHTFRMGAYDDSDVSRRIAQEQNLGREFAFEPTVQEVGARSDAAQPCTVFNETTGELVVLPGCRGIAFVGQENDPNSTTGQRYVVTFQENYLPSVDGCVFGDTRQLVDGVPQPGDGQLDIGGIPVVARAFDGTVVSGPGAGDTQLARELEGCAATENSFASQSNTRVNLPGDSDSFGELGVPVQGARSMFHPLAGCLPDEDAASLDSRRNNCDWMNRNFADELAGFDPDRGPGNVFLFESEGAAMSYNVQMFFVTSSCAGDSQEEILADRECFDAADSFSPQRCSFAAPQFCSNVKSFVGLTGPRRNVVQAGGTNGRGRRVFLWNSGGEIVLQYDQRNVLGFSMDFAEDVSKTNWNMEFTWVGSETVFDSNSFNGISDVNALNLTVSVDRPTFINFLNPNRTFFFNSQWFFQYFPDWEDSMTGTVAAAVRIGLRLPVAVGRNPAPDAVPLYREFLGHHRREPLLRAHPALRHAGPGCGAERQPRGPERLRERWRRPVVELPDPGRDLPSPSLDVLGRAFALTHRSRSG
jgi:hypothetical protein